MTDIVIEIVNITSTQSGNYHPPHHYHNQDNVILSTDADILLDAREQYPMMNVVLITVSTVLICLCLLSIRGWKKYFWDRKMEKLGVYE